MGGYSRRGVARDHELFIGRHDPDRQGRVWRGNRPGRSADGEAVALLVGHGAQVDLGGLLIQSFRIDHIESKGGETLIHSHDEPGMTVTPGLVKLEYFPNWGIAGQARFKIAGSALLRENPSGQWQLAASGAASATVKGKQIAHSRK